MVGNGEDPTRFCVHGCQINLILAISLWSLVFKRYCGFAMKTLLTLEAPTKVALASKSAPTAKLFVSPYVAALPSTLLKDCVTARYGTISAVKYSADGGAAKSSGMAYPSAAWDVKLVFPATPSRVTVAVAGLSPLNASFCFASMFRSSEL